MDWHKKKLGININGRRLTNLRFADDIVLFAKKDEELRLMLKELHLKSKEVGLSMNMNKTKLMSTNNIIPITIDGTTIEQIEEYIYLGQLITVKRNGEKEIEELHRHGGNSTVLNLSYKTDHSIKV